MGQCFDCHFWRTSTTYFQVNRAPGRSRICTNSDAD